MKYFLWLLAATAGFGAAILIAGWYFNADFFKRTGADPSFVGALVGAAGTILTALVAFAIVVYQNDQDDRRNSEMKQASLNYQIEQIRNEAAVLETAAQRIEEILQPFSGLNAASPADWRDKLIEMKLGGQLPMNVCPSNLHGLLADQLREWGGQINQLAYEGINIRVTRTQTGGIADFRQVDWDQLNSSVRDRIAVGRSLKSQLSTAAAAKHDQSK